MTDSTPAESQDSGAQADEGPGWLPAIMAGTLLLGIGGFICCGVSTWYLYTKRSELALRTLRQTYLPELEQSRLSPDDKDATVKVVEEFADNLERGKYENWQAAGVMQRLIRLPVLQWGELSVVESYIEKHAEDFDENALVELMRLRRAVEMDQATTIDFEDVLSPVMETDDSTQFGRSLIEPLTAASVAEVIRRAKLVSDRAKVPETLTKQPSIAKIVERQIEAGIEDGSY